MPDFKCQRCGECCRKYYIISLPSEVEKQAQSINLSEKDFVDEKMQLFLQIFPATFKEREAMVSSSLLPKEISEKIESQLNFMPNFFLVMPMLAFRRKEKGYCTFFDTKEMGCTLYAQRPLECRMFPFISDKKTENYSRLYPFCEGLHFKDENKSYLDAGYIHFENVGAYMKDVEEKGFKAVWKHWPKNGVILLEDKLIGEISEKEFFQTIGPLG